MSNASRSPWLGLVISCALALAPVAARAAGTTKYPWNIPDNNVRIVQAAPVDGVRTFATIQAAVSSITTASATNRFLVKVMPGTYTEDVVLKDHVDLEGSGVDNTIIQTASCGSQALLADAISGIVTISNVTVRNDCPTISSYGSYGIRATAAAGAAPQLKVHDVIVRVSYGNPCAGILSEVPIEVRSSSIFMAHGGDALSAWAFDGGGYVPVTVEDSSFDVKASSESEPPSYGILATAPSPVVVRNTRITMAHPLMNIGIAHPTLVERSDIQITSNGSQNVGLAYPLPGARITGTRVSVIAPGQAYGIRADGGEPTSVNFKVESSNISGTQVGIEISTANPVDVEVNNSTISGEGVNSILKVQTGSGRVRVANSRLDGPHTLVPGVDKVVNSVDQNYDPLPGF